MSTSSITLPQDDEVEISLFGPGTGECIVLHLGGGEWMMVDSCTAAGRPKQSVGITYLKKLGVDVAANLKLIVATHWHDDHIRGMSNAVEEAGSSEFACSKALQHIDFFSLLSAGITTGLKKLSSGVSEFNGILEALQCRPTGKARSGPHHWAGENQKIFKSKHGVDVFSLSPSAQTVTDAYALLAPLLPKAGKAVHRIRDENPNHTSIVLQIVTPTKSILLGGDLEQRAEPHYGWTAVVNSTLRPQITSGVYKVAHHGSSNAYLGHHWGALIAPSSVSLVAPYTKLRNPLPTKSGVAAIKSNVTALYCTHWPHKRRPNNYGKPINKLLDSILLSRNAIGVDCGQIRYRFSTSLANDPGRIDLFDGATVL